MRDYQAITINEVSQIDKNKKIVIFGAGETGRKWSRKLREKGYHVTAFWDNDVLKQQTRIDGIEVISYEQLSHLSEYYLILGSAYALQEVERINQLNYIAVIQLVEENYADLIIKKFARDEADCRYYVKHGLEIKNIATDEESRRVCEHLYRFIAEKDFRYLINISSEEEHYLINEVKLALPQESVLIDAGAYTGEFPRALQKARISFNKCYCFEADKNTAGQLAENMERLALEHKVVCVKKGLSETTGSMYIEGKGAAAQIVPHKTSQALETISIDEFFAGIPFDFIKMDIEGMELPALRGGLKQIQRNRPILAISVYHSLRERIDIPLYLKEYLSEYVFLLRHHSIWFAETVLYGIPKERFGGAI